MQPAIAPSERRRLMLIVGLCGALGVAAGAFYVAAFAATFGQDWTVFFTAVRLAFDGHLANLYDVDRFTALVDARFGLPALGPHPWLYPPSYLLLLLPFGLLPFAASLGAFLVLGAVAAVVAVQSAVVRGWPRWFDAAALLLSPAAALTVALGQNSFWTVALLVGGFRLVPASPVLGGILLGLATYKPQLWLLVPVALVAARRWTALASAAVTAILLVAASVAVFGLAPWQHWIALLSGGGAYARWTTVGELRGQSVYACVVLLGGSRTVGLLVQALAAAAAVGAVWWIHRRMRETDLQLVVLLAATLLATPHVMDYDALLLVVAATLLFERGLVDGFRSGEIAIVTLLWLSTAFPPVLFRVGLIGSVLTALIVAAALRRGGYSNRICTSSPITRTG
ncbi:MAG: DUF2029 domain-containing protein [Alphaproteobacteria bacterium]|nr:DUF2029 domain-containing protein [Alphaproteobacteria bacterium]